MTKFKNRFDKTKLLNKKFGMLTIISYSHCTKTEKHTTHYWLCKCDCGNEKTVQNSHLVHGSTESCGCNRYNPLNYSTTHTYEEMRKLHDSIPEDENGCKIWTKNINSKGYGKISFENKTCEAHRVIYRAFHGDIEKGKVIRHLCNVPACVSIHHLAMGTQKDNAQDAVKAGSYKTGVNHHSSKLTEEQVRYIRKHEMDIGNPTLGRKYGTSHKSIERIKKRITWKHIS